MDIKCLNDLNSFRSAPQLSKIQQEKLLVELELNILESDWVTIGIMAANDKAAIKALSSILEKYSNIKFRDLNSLSADGSVFLKGNQKTGNVFIRSESGLGEGILLTCQYEDAAFKSFTYGPFPLDFFTN